MCDHTVDLEIVVILLTFLGEVYVDCLLLDLNKVCTGVVVYETFLAQELNRESNTLTAKSNDVELTNIGVELKTVVEQFREQVQNHE